MYVFIPMEMEMPTSLAARIASHTGESPDAWSYGSRKGYRIEVDCFTPDIQVQFRSHPYLVEIEGLHGYEIPLNTESVTAQAIADTWAQHNGGKP